MCCKQGTARTLADVPHFLALMHAVEGAAGGETLAPLAEALLDTLEGSGQDEVAAAVAALRGATARRRAELAARRRQQMLTSMAFSQVKSHVDAACNAAPHPCLSEGLGQHIILRLAEVTEQQQLCPHICSALHLRLNETCW